VILPVSCSAASLESPKAGINVTAGQHGKMEEKNQTRGAGNVSHSVIPCNKNA
jgi:hypothetical protein